MYELTLHVRPTGTQKYIELIVVNSNYIHDKIADFMSVVSGWDFRNGEYYNAPMYLRDLQICSKGLDILLDMGLEPYMRKQVSQVCELLEEICLEIEDFKVEMKENRFFSGMYLRWRYS